MTPQDIAEKFPAFNFYASVPELQNLWTMFGNDPSASTNAFNLALWNTNWWKSMSQTARDWQKTQLMDPATAKQQAATMGSNVNATALGLGYHLSPNEVAYITQEALSQGWDNQTITRQLVDHISRGRLQAGTIDATKDSLMSTAAQYGVNMSDKNYMDWATNIAAGRQTTEAFTDYAKYHAKAAYPQLQKELDSGLTVRQIADPYLQTAANLLGVDSNQMQLTDPKWQRALQGRDPHNKIVGPMTMADWQRTVMTDASYGYDHSDNAKSAARSLVDSLGQSFGVKAA